MSGPGGSPTEPIGYPQDVSWFDRLRAALSATAPGPRVVQLTRTATAAEAFLLATLLQDRGIPAEAVDLGMDMVFTGQPQGGRVLVRARDVEHARTVVAHATEPDADQD